MTDELKWCPTCRIVRKGLSPFVGMVGDVMRYFIELPNFNTNEKYQAQGVEHDKVLIHFCPTCGLSLDE